MKCVLDWWCRNGKSSQCLCVSSCAIFLFGSGPLLGYIIFVLMNKGLEQNKQKCIRFLHKCSSLMSQQCLGMSHQMPQMLKETLCMNFADGHYPKCLPLRLALITWLFQSSTNLLDLISSKVLRLIPTNSHHWLCLVDHISQVAAWVVAVFLVMVTVLLVMVADLLVAVAVLVSMSAAS